MDNKYTIQGFQNHCDTIGYKFYKYTTEIQDTTEGNLKIIATFDKLRTTLSPDRVYLIGENGFSLMAFQKVKYIILHEGHMDDDVFNIVCDDITHNGNDEREITYKVIAGI